MKELVGETQSESDGKKIWLRTMQLFSSDWQQLDEINGNYSESMWRLVIAPGEKGPSALSDQQVGLQPFILERTHILFITHLIIVHAFPPHIICSSVSLVPGARSVRSCSSQRSERVKMRPERLLCLSFFALNNSASVQRVPELKGWLCQLWYPHLPHLRHLEAEM